MKHPVLAHVFTPILALVLSLLSVPASAQLNTGAAASATEARPVTISLSQKKVKKDERGREVLVEATSVLPNDVIEYRAVYRNVGTGVVKRVSAALPLPEGLEYLPHSAQPKKGVQFAGAAANVYGPEPLQRTLANGRVEPLPYNEYRQIRWAIDELAPGAEVTVVARARVESVKPPAVAAAPTTVAGGAAKP